MPSQHLTAMQNSSDSIFADTHQFHLTFEEGLLEPNVGSMQEDGGEANARAGGESRDEACKADDAVVSDAPEYESSEAMRLAP